MSLQETPSADRVDLLQRGFFDATSRAWHCTGRLRRPGPPSGVATPWRAAAAPSREDDMFFLQKNSEIQWR